jgi:hypothetical protein
MHPAAWELLSLGYLRRIAARVVVEPRSIWEQPAPVPLSGGELIVRNAFRKYLTLVHRRPTFAVGLIAVFVVGVQLEIAGNTDLAHVSSHDAYRQFLSSFGDALIVAAVLAALVDPIVQQFAS